MCVYYFFLYGPATTEIYTYGHTHSLHDALPLRHYARMGVAVCGDPPARYRVDPAVALRIVEAGAGGALDQGDRFPEAVLGEGVPDGTFGRFVHCAVPAKADHPPVRFFVRPVAETGGDEKEKREPPGPSLWEQGVDRSESPRVGMKWVSQVRKRWA